MDKSCSTENSTLCRLTCARVLAHNVSYQLLNAFSTPGKYFYQWRIQISQSRGRQLQRWGRQPIILANFLQKLHEKERIWTWRVRTSLPLLLESANVLILEFDQYNVLRKQNFLVESRVNRKRIKHRSEKSASNCSSPRPTTSVWQSEKIFIVQFITSSKFSMQTFRQIHDESVSSKLVITMIHLT